MLAWLTPAAWALVAEPALQAEMLRDPGGHLTPSDLENPALRAQGRWQTVPSGALALGLSSDVIWLRLVVPALPGGEAGRWLVAGLPFLDDLRLYAPAPPGGPAPPPLRAGDHVPVAERPTRLREAVFPLRLAATPTVYHLRLQSTSTLTLRLRLWEPQRYTEQAASDQLLEGLLQGLMVTSAVISLLAGVLLRQWFYFIVAAYLLCFGALHLALHGHDQLLLYPHSPWWNERALGVLGHAATLLMIAFALSYLQPQRHHVWLGRALQVLMLLCAAGMLGSALGHYALLARWLYLCAGLTVLLLVVLTTLMLRHEPQRALLMALMFLPSLLAAALQILRNAGWLPLNFWTTGLWELTALLQMPFAAVVVLLQMRAEQRQRVHIDLRDRERQDFLNLMAHELRTPLAVLGAALTNIQLRTEEQQPDTKPRFQRAGTALARLNMLVDKALAEERLRDSRVQLDLQPTRPSQLIEQVRPLLLVEPPHTLQLLLPADDRPLLLDAQWLGMALLNLLDNAVKYSPQGGLVSLHVERDMALLRLVVGDRGIGVPAADSSGLFQRFFRAGNTAGRVPGLGLGLFLAAEVARRHGGQVRAEANAGGSGSRFTIEIPAHSS